MSDRAWIGVDLDGTLAEYDGWKGIEHIGPPVEKMAQRVRAWLALGRKVKIFTARVCHGDAQGAAPHIRAWCERHFGVPLEVTCEKDFAMTELWDDRAVQVHENTGVRADGRV